MDVQTGHADRSVQRRYPHGTPALVEPQIRPLVRRDAQTWSDGYRSWEVEVRKRGGKGASRRQAVQDAGAGSDAGCRTCAGHRGSGPSELAGAACRRSVGTTVTCGQPCIRR
jgi:hypothetical protein